MVSKRVEGTLPSQQTAW